MKMQITDQMQTVSSLTKCMQTVSSLSKCMQTVSNMQTVSRHYHSWWNTIFAYFNAVRLFVFVPIPWTLQLHFTLWMSAQTLQCVF